MNFELLERGTYGVAESHGIYLMFDDKINRKGAKSAKKIIIIQ